MHSRLGSRYLKNYRGVIRVLGKPRLGLLTVGGILCVASLKTSHCDAGVEQGQKDTSADAVSDGNNKGPSGKPDPVEQFIAQYGPELEGVGFGGVMGICCGVAFRRISSAIAYSVGIAFLGLQALSYAGYININYHKAVDDASKVLDLDKDGKLTSKDAVYAWRNLKKILTFNLPGMSGFSVGVMIGMYFG